MKTLSTARSLLLASRQNVCVNFTNSALYADHHAVIKEIARNHRRRNHHSCTRMSLGDISNGSSSNYKSDFSDYRSKGVSFGDKEQSLDDIAMKNNVGIASAHFAYIITRPTTFLKDGRSIKKVSASKSVSGYGVQMLFCVIFV